MKRHRLFIAAPLPRDVVKRCERAMAQWVDLPVRWTKPENLHVTLHFIGSTDDDGLARVAASLAPAVEDLAPFDAHLERITLGPTAKSPRMVWLEGPSMPDLSVLAARLADATRDALGEPAHDTDGAGDEPSISLDDDGGGADEDAAQDAVSPHVRPFRLHVTLGRIVPVQWRRLAPAPILDMPFKAVVPFTSVMLVSSETGPGGPTYTPLTDAPLAG